MRIPLSITVVKYRILPYDLLIKQAQLMFLHSLEHDLATRSFSTTCTNISDREPAINLRNSNDFYLPPPRKDTFKKSAWNALTPNIKYKLTKIWVPQ